MCDRPTCMHNIYIHDVCTCDMTVYMHIYICTYACMCLCTCMEGTVYCSCVHVRVQVSNGADIVMISKEFLVSHMTEVLKVKLQRKVTFHS